MAIDVYYATYVENNANVLRVTDSPEPKRLTKNLAEEYRNVLNGYLSCPAATNLFKNTFTIQSDSEFQINFDRPSLHYNLHISEKTHGIFGGAISTNYLFFSKEEVEIELLPAYMHKNDFTIKTVLPAGKFNISKWYRPVHAEFYCFDKTTISVNKHDHLFYVNFDTKETVNLKRYNITQTHINIEQLCLSLKQHCPRNTLEQNYEFFMERELDKKLSLE